MASDELRKKWGTIFMGDREASVEQLNAMQEPLYREKLQKNRTEDYMERVKAKAADRAREILGATYAERQKVLEEAKAEGEARKRLAAQECAKLKAEGEAARQMAQAELDKARAIREEAERIRASAHEEGLRKGMEDAGKELHEFRAELGQSVGSVLLAIERQRRNILDTWREELVELVKCAVQAGAGFVLHEEHETILRALVMQALDMLENRSVITARVNPDDEAAVSDMFRAARERVPELKQWIVSGDPGIERCGLIVDSGSGSVDLRRENFRAMVDGVLAHLALPDKSGDAVQSREVQDIVEREVAHIASLTPELDQPEPARAKTEQVDQVQPETASGQDSVPEVAVQGENMEENMPEQTPPEQLDAALETGAAEGAAGKDAEVPPDAADLETYEALEEELFPLSEEPEASPQAPMAHESTKMPPASPAQPVSEKNAQASPQTAQEKTAQAVSQPRTPPLADPATLAEGGFL